MSAKTIRFLKFFKLKNSCLALNGGDLKPSLTPVRNYWNRYSSKVDPLPTRYGGKANVTILSGTGIGPEIVNSTLKVLEAAEAPLYYEILSLPEDNDVDEFEEVITSVRRNRVCLKGNIEVQTKNPYIASRSVLFRKNLDLFVFVLRCKTFPGLRNIFGEMDIILIRQNTEGEYLMLEHEPTVGAVENLKVITRFNSERVANFAFRYAIKHDRKLVTVIHSSFSQAATEGLFVEVAREVAKNYPSIQLKVVDMSLAITKIMKNPALFDVILTTNLNGSLLSSIMNGMLGGPGLSAGINYGEQGVAVFEPGARNKGSSIKDLGIANPIAMITSAVNMLDHLGYQKTANIISQSVFATLVFDQVYSKDLGGTATTKEITDKIIYHVKQWLKPKKVKKSYNLLHHRWKAYCPVDEKDVPKNKKNQK